MWKATLQGVFSLANSDAAKTALNVIAGAAGEGTEEFIAEIAQGYLDKLTIQTDERNFWQMVEDGAYNALVSGITSILFGTADIISGGNGKLPTAEDLESITTQAADETVSSIAANAAVLGGNTEAKSTDGNTRLTENDITEYVATGERQHVRNGKEAQIRTGDSPILTTPASIVGFIKDALTGKRRNVIKAYGRVGQRFSKDVYAKSEGITNISGYYMELDANKLAHMKDHLEVDEDLRNIPLTEDQLVYLPDYIDNYDDVVDVVRRKDGSVRIILGKKINGHTVIVETVSKGRKSVHPVTAYQIPTERYNSFYKTKAATTNTSQTASAAESGYKAITASVDNIPQVKNEVNGKTGSEPSPFLYLERLAEQAKKSGNLYTQRLLQRQIEKALQNSHSADTEASTPMPTIYADYMREHNMLEDYETSEDLNVDLENEGNSDTIFAGAVTDCFDRKVGIASAEEDLIEVNPNYAQKSYEWTNNCQRCVPAYEMRRRGFKVVARPLPGKVLDDILANNAIAAWKRQERVWCIKGNGLQQIKEQMSKWGNGARAEVSVAWRDDYPHFHGHVFIAEQRNGRTVFMDPQTGDSDCSRYFDMVVRGRTSMWRIDDNTPSDLILECCMNEGAKK